VEILKIMLGCRRESGAHHFNWRMIKMCASFCSVNLIRPCGVRVGAESGCDRPSEEEASSS